MLLGELGELGQSIHAYEKLAWVSAASKLKTYFNIRTFPHYLEVSMWKPDTLLPWPSLLEEQGYVTWVLLT